MAILPSTVTKVRISLVPTRHIARVIEQVVGYLRRRPDRWVPVWVIFADGGKVAGKRSRAITSAVESWDWPKSIEVRWYCGSPSAFRYRGEEQVV